jgi:hypothetical protein
MRKLIDGIKAVTILFCILVLIYAGWLTAIFLTVVASGMIIYYILQLAREVSSA